MSRSDYARRYVQKRKRSVITEVGLFAAGFGAILLTMGIVFYLSNNPDKLMGMPRGQLIGSVVGLLGILCMVPGVLLLIMRSKPMIWASLVCASIPSLLVFGLLATAAATAKDFIGLVFFLAVPALLFARGLKALKEVDEEIAKARGENNLGNTPQPSADTIE
jgi:hypothetical protein